MSGVVAKKGLLRKTNSAGKKVMRDRTKAGLWGLGGLALFTPFGGNLISGLTGQAAENTSKTIGSIGDGAMLGMTQAPISMISPLTSATDLSSRANTSCDGWLNQSSVKLIATPRRPP